MPDPIREATTPAREWLFRSDGQVFGPVPEERLVELIATGRIGPASEVSEDVPGDADVRDRRWRPLRDEPRLLVHVRMAEARARVEAEVTGSRRLAARRRALGWTASVVLGTALLVAAAAAAWYLAVHRPWAPRSDLLSEFGDGIAIGAVRVGASARSEAMADDEVAVPEPGAPAPDPSRAPARAKRPGARPRPAVAGKATGEGAVVLAQYDPARIQQAVARQQGTLAPCVREEAQRSPEFSGDIPIEFAVGNDGRLAQLWIDDPRFKTGPLRDCLEQRLRAWTFDRFPGERPVVSLSFRIGRR